MVNTWWSPYHLRYTQSAWMGARVKPWCLYLTQYPSLQPARSLCSNLVPHLNLISVNRSDLLRNRWFSCFQEYVIPLGGYNYRIFQATTTHLNDGTWRCLQVPNALFPASLLWSYPHLVLAPKEAGRSGNNSSYTKLTGVEQQEQQLQKNRDSVWKVQKSTFLLLQPPQPVLLHHHNQLHLKSWEEL